MNKRIPLLLMFVIFLSTLLASCTNPWDSRPPKPYFPEEGRSNPDPNNTTDPQIPAKPKSLEEIGKSVVRVIEGCSLRVSVKNKTYNLKPYGLGSGFFVDRNGYLVTAAHVTQLTREVNSNNIKELCGPILFKQFLYEIASELGKEPAELTREEISYIEKNVRPESRIDNFSFVLVDGKQFPFDIKAFGAPIDLKTLKGKDVAVIKVNLTDTPILKLVKDSSKVEIQDEVTAIGYPAVAQLQGLDQLNSSPTFSKGTISSKTEFNGSPIFQIDASIYGGNSGGPIINKNREVIGIVIAGIKGTNIAYVVPSNIVREFVRQAGANNQ